MIATDERAALLRAIKANPDDLTLRLVYADWLEEYGSQQEICAAKYIRHAMNYRASLGRIEPAKRMGRIEPARRIYTGRRVYAIDSPVTPAEQWFSGQLLSRPVLMGGSDYAMRYAGDYPDSVIIFGDGMVEGVMASDCNTIPWEVIRENPVRWVTIADRVPASAGWYWEGRGMEAALPESCLPNSWHSVASDWGLYSVANSLGTKLNRPYYYQLLSDFLIWYADHQ